MIVDFSYDFARQSSYHQVKALSLYSIYNNIFLWFMIPWRTDLRCCRWRFPWTISFAGSGYLNFQKTLVIVERFS